MKAKSPILFIDGLTINSQDSMLLEGLSFSVFPNEIIAIVGESGSGKSLTALSIAGLLSDSKLKVSSKKMRLGKHDLSALSAKDWEEIRGKNLGMVFQEPQSSLNPSMRCGPQLMERLQKFKNDDKYTNKIRVLLSFEQVQLPDPERIFRAYPHELSGGQKQRVMIAMALICNPQLLIADEPTTALDVTVQKEILSLLKAKQKTNKMSILFISHDLSLVAKFADRVMVMHIGAFAVADCLAAGAQIVIAGRVTDPALVGGPMIHEFGWSPEDYDKLAASTVAGHIAECGAQCTGGNYTNWRDVNDFVKIGYPVIEARADGQFVVTKHDGTGGLLTRNTVVSQLLYEMGDPERYLGPDCAADFTSAKVEEVGPNRVQVSGVKGGAPTETYKISLSYQNGYKAVGQLTVAGPDALEKAKLCADIVWGRLALDGCEFAEDEKMVEYVGSGVTHAGILGTDNPPEVVLRIGVKSMDKAKVTRFGSEIVPLVTSGPPGVTGFAGGRPKATDIVGYWPALLDKTQVQTQVRVEES